VTVRVQDSGGTAGGGVDISAPQSFTVNITPVNDPPSFTRGPDQLVQDDPLPQTVPGWATNISTGPADEAGQSSSFVVTADNPALFSVQPAISPDGTLTYTPAANTNGTTNVTVVLQDSGGTADGGVDTSAPQTFAIRLQTTAVFGTANQVFIA